jgi:hypothetical protein
MEVRVRTNSASRLLGSLRTLVEKQTTFRVATLPARSWQSR